ncbi:MAG: response regulator [Myxococcales bacterium]
MARPRSRARPSHCCSFRTSSRTQRRPSGSTRRREACPASTSSSAPSCAGCRTASSRPPTCGWTSKKAGARNLTALKRVLHTVKGEAHMLGLSATGGLLQELEGLVVKAQAAGVAGRSAGSSVLEALDALSVLSGTPEQGEATFDLGPVLDSLRHSAAALVVAPSQAPVAHPEADAGASPPDGVQGAARHDDDSDDRRSVNQVRVDEIQPTIHDLRRLFEEQAQTQRRLREVQRILRAVVAEIDPALPPAVLGERVIKTLGATADLERRLSAIRSEWSANAFATGLALDHLSDTTRRAAVVSVARLRTSLERTLRSTSKSLKKEVQMRVEGDAYIDAVIAQRLEPALLHAVRNSVDHGIEEPAERIARGKAASGMIEVRISQLVSMVQVIVQDDGRGVDVRALRRRLQAAEDLSDTQVLHMLFRSGVSTRDQVSDISGRGVGLDVVAREVAAVGGSAQIETTPGLGFRLILTLPSVLRADLVVPIGIGDKRLALPCRSVEGFSRIARIEDTTRGLYARVRSGDQDVSLPVYSLASVFGHSAAPSSGARGVLVVHEGFRFVLVVDQHENPRTLPFQPISELAVRSRVVRAVAPSPEGVRLLLDVGALVRALQGSTLKVSTEQSRGTARVVVVEDAPVARELLCGILRSFGLEVFEAAHGREGLAVIRERAPNLVLSDVEMPFLSGLDMVSTLRQEARFADLRVIFLTTDTSEVTRRRAGALGAVGFLSKQRFVEDELRRLVDSCLAL